MLLPALQVVLTYSSDAKEINWQNGQPVQRPYRGPAQLRFEQVGGIRLYCLPQCGCTLCCWGMLK